MRALAIDDTVVVPLPVDIVWAAVTEPARLAACVPGLTSLGGPGPQQMRWRLRIGDRTVTYRGTGAAEADPARQHVRWRLAGREVRGGGTVTADLEVSLQARAATTAVTVRVSIEGTGAVAALDGATTAATVHRVLLATRRAALRADQQAPAPAAAPLQPALTPFPAMEIVPLAERASGWRRVVARVRPRRPALLAAGGTAAVVLLTAAVRGLAWWRRGPRRRR